MRKVTKWGQVLLWILNFEDLKHPNMEKWKNVKNVTYFNINMKWLFTEIQKTLTINLTGLIFLDVFTIYIS